MRQSLKDTRAKLRDLSKSTTTKSDKKSRVNPDLLPYKIEPVSTLGGLLAKSAENLDLGRGPQG